MIKRDTAHFIGIGFCTPKSYKPHVWRKAKAIMEWLCDHTLYVERFNYGRGGGKYRTKGDWMDKDLWKECIPGLAAIYDIAHGHHTGEQQV